jgi:hypothetical protein
LARSPIIGGRESKEVTMRGVLVAAVAAAGLLLASFASAQGLGDVADREKQKRKAAPPSEVKAYDQNDLGPSVAPVGVPTSLPATTDEATEEDGEGGGDEAAEAAAEAEALAEASWRKKLEQARKEEEVYREVSERLQLELNDTSGGIYNPGRAARLQFLEENKQLLADTQQRVATLEAEGRANGYR